MFKFLPRSWRGATMQEVSMRQDIYEEERKVRLEQERERQSARQEAMQQARQKSGLLKLGDTEEQLKRISEEVTIEAAEKKKRLVTVAKKAREHGQTMEKSRHFLGLDS